MEKPKPARQEILTNERVTSMNVSFFPYFFFFEQKKDLRKSEGRKKGKRKTTTPFRKKPYDTMFLKFPKFFLRPHLRCEGGGGLSDNTAKGIRP